MQVKAAELILENGIKFKGKAFGYVHDAVGEVIFSTAMTGYQEAITDPSMCGEMLVLTYPLIGNYGANLEDIESDNPSVSALIVREVCTAPNNFRAEMDLDAFLKQNKILGLEGIDTRALTRIIRNSGCMRAIITTKVGELSDDDVKSLLDGYDNSKAVSKVSAKKKYDVNPKGTGKKVAVIDLGMRKSFIGALADRGCFVSVFPYNASADEILSVNPDVVIYTSGPGNPEDIPETVENAKQLIGKVPVRGICLGHLVVGIALGCGVEKLKFGHHGASQPVKCGETGKVVVTAQCHNYSLCDIPDGICVTYKNINDGTCEGIKSEKYDVSSVQFRPAYTSDSLNIIDNFLA